MLDLPADDILLRNLMRTVSFLFLHNPVVLPLIADTVHTGNSFRTVLTGSC